MFGLDFLGLGSKEWRVKPSIDAFPHGFALGAFATTFGDALPNVRRFLQRGKVKAFRLQAWWSDAHKIAPIAYLQSELPRWERLAKEFPHIPFYISHSCEYSEKSLDEIKKRVALVKKLCPSCIVVQSPYKSPVVKGELVENHGVDAKKCDIVSTDGIAAFDINIQSWIKKHEASQIVFLWAPRFNLREAYKPPAKLPPPKERTAFPGPKYIKGVVALTKPVGVVPVPMFQAIPLKAPQLYKTFAEDMPGESMRDNRPMLILKNKTEDVKIVTWNEKVIGRFKYYGTYNGSLFRYYSGVPGASGLFAFEIAEEAFSLSGTTYVWVKQGDKYFGPIAAAFRTPYFQK